KAGEKINTIPQPNDILKDTHNLEYHEVKDRIDYCIAKRFAAKQIIFFFNNMQINKYRKSCNSSKSWHFAKCGSVVYDDTDITYYPVRTIRPKTIFRKDLIEPLKMEMMEWENVLRELRKIHGE